MKKIKDFFIDSLMLFIFAVKTAWVLMIHKTKTEEEETNERNIKK